jgi:mannose-6-phosphate isomerase
MACYRLRNPVRRYAWGSDRVLPEFLGEPNPASEPWAELWIGAHGRASSSVEVGGVWRPLRRFVEAHPARVLGERVLARFGAQLPFLLKVLAVEPALAPDPPRPGGGGPRLGAGGGRTHPRRRSGAELS